MGCGGSRTKENKARVMCIVGGPGSGKGTQSDILITEFGFKHLSTGDLLRKEIENKGPQAEEIENIQKEGGLVSSEILVKLVKAEIENQGLGNRYILDGFPRNQENLDVWNKLMKDITHISCYLYFDCDFKILEERMLKRAQNSTRNDDNPESINKRIKNYQEITIPLYEGLKKKEKCFHTINTNRTIEDIAAELKKIIMKNKLDK
jgi:adenylate kinase family enzyme